MSGTFTMNRYDEGVTEERPVSPTTPGCSPFTMLSFQTLAPSGSRDEHDKMFASYEDRAPNRVSFFNKMNKVRDVGPSQSKLHMLGDRRAKISASVLKTGRVISSKVAALPSTLLSHRLEISLVPVPSTRNTAKGAPQMHHCAAVKASSAWFLPHPGMKNVHGLRDLEPAPPDLSESTILQVERALDRARLRAKNVSEKLATPENVIKRDKLGFTAGIALLIFTEYVFLQEVFSHLAVPRSTMIDTLKPSKCQVLTQIRVIRSAIGSRHGTRL